MNHSAAKTTENTQTPSIWVDTDEQSNFIYQYLNDRDHLGMFIETDTPFQVDTPVNLIFQDNQYDRIVSAQGEVSFVNMNTKHHRTPNPGMGIRLLNLDDENAAHISRIVNRIAYI